MITWSRLFSPWSRDPGHIAHDIADAHHHLILDQFLRYHRDRLGNIAHRRQCLGAAARSGQLVAGVVHRHRVEMGSNLQHNLPI